MLAVAFLVLLIPLAISLERWCTGTPLTEPVAVGLADQDTTESEHHAFHPIEEGNVRSALGMSSGDQSRHNE